MLAIGLAPALVASAAAFFMRRDRVCLAGTIATFVLAGWVLAADASRRSLLAPLLDLFQSAADKTDTASDEPAALVDIEGELREDASMSGGVHSLSIAVSRVTSGAAAGATRGGVLLTVYGTLATGRAGEWRRGRRVHATAQLRLPTTFRDPGVPDSRLALAYRGSVLVGSIKSGALVEVVARGTLLQEAAATVRAFVRRTLREAVGCWNPQSAAIVTAILIGDRAGLDDDLRLRLQQAGTYHVMAISGGNIAILAGLSLVLVRLAGFSQRPASLMTAAALVSYAGLVGGGASVTRATLMGVTFLIARVGDLRGAAANSLALSAAVILAATPLSVFDAAFALTVGATGGILAGAALIGPRLPRRRWLRAPAALGLASVSAELAVLPIGALVFSRVTFAGLALNFIAIPMMTVVQIAGMAVLPASVVSITAARGVGWIAHLGAAGLVGSAGLVEVAPWLTFRLPPPRLWVVAAYYGSLIVWVLCAGACRSRTTRVRGLHVVRRLGAGCAVIAGLCLLRPPASLVPERGDGRLAVTFLDVGYADAILTRFPDGQSLLLDTGGSRGGSSFDVGSRVVAPALWALGVRRLDYLVLSHGDPDHAGGASSVLRDFAPREIWEGVPVPPDPLLNVLRLAAGRARIPWRTVRAGDAMRFGGVELRVLHPPPPDWERQRVRNDDSLVCELKVGRVSVLLPGDIGSEVESVLGPRIPPAAIRVLKVPHHGSAGSSTAAFVRALRPSVAILTVGRGARVAPALVERYRAAGAEVFRTDEDGAVSVETDGNRVVVQGFTGRRLILQAPRP